jgi:hypothetical protein
VSNKAAAGGTYLVCPICFKAKHLDESALIKGATLGGTVPMWEWIGDENATTFSYRSPGGVAVAAPGRDLRPWAAIRPARTVGTRVPHGWAPREMLR